MTALWSPAELTGRVRRRPQRAAERSCPRRFDRQPDPRAGRSLHCNQGRRPRRARSRRSRLRIRRRRGGRLGRAGGPACRARTHFRRRRHSERNGAAGRRRSRAVKSADRRGDWLGRQDDGQGDAARHAFGLRPDPRLGSFLQQSLGRAADARADAGERALRRPGDRHEPCRRDCAADADGAPPRGPGDDHRSRSRRISRLDRSDRRREGRDLPWT